MAQEAAQQMSMAINDMDTLQIGLAIDQKQEVGALEYIVTAVRHEVGRADGPEQEQRRSLPASSSRTRP